MRLTSIVAISACVVLAWPATAQEPADTSLVERLERAEQMIEILRQQMAEQATSRVEPRSRYHVELSGMVLMNAFYNSAPVSEQDVPIIALAPEPPGGLPSSYLGATARQTHLALTGFVTDVLGGFLTGEIQVDLGGTDNSGRRFAPQPRLRRTRAQLEWDNAWIMVGQEAPPISEINPASIAATTLPVFSAAGNLWYWIPQIRVGGASAGPIRVGGEVAALAPTYGSGGLPGRGERTSRPFVQARALARWGDFDQPSEVSIGVHQGWLAVGETETEDTRAVGGWARVFISRYVEVRGEAFRGQALGTLGGGAQGRDLVDGQPVSTTGGWAQVNVHPNHSVMFGVGYGMDDPKDEDVGETALLKNWAWQGHLQWRAAPIVVGLEVRRHSTRYGNPDIGRQDATHVNLGLGFVF